MSSFGQFVQTWYITCENHRLIMNKFKEFIRPFLYYIKRKPYRIKLAEGIATINSIRSKSDKEYFFGYYDHSPEHNGKVLFHEMQENEKSVRVFVKDIVTGEEHFVSEVSSFNWQMGCRAMWIDDDTISYNDFNGKEYVCIWYSLSKGVIIKVFDKALQDYSSSLKMFVGVNYQRLCSYTKEYGYYCLPKMSDYVFKDYSNDGIWMADVKSGKTILLLSLDEILKFEPENIKPNGNHFVNHIMMNPNGYSFIFIHRYYVGKERNDRLILWQGGVLKSLFAGRIHSHYCWLDETHVFGYGDYKGTRGFHSIDIVTTEVKCFPELDTAHPRDGHPTVYGDWICIDDYPDVSRMQALLLYNIKTKCVYKVGEFFHDLKHKDYNRCDLHPRFSDDGKSIYIDTIYDGKRKLLKLDINFEKI